MSIFHVYEFKHIIYFIGGIARFCKERHKSARLSQLLLDGRKIAPLLQPK